MRTHYLQILLCCLLFDIGNGVAKLFARQACQPTRTQLDPQLLMFMDSLDSTHSTPRPEHRHRELRARSCRRGTVTYRARREGALPVDCGRCAVLDVAMVMRETSTRTLHWGRFPELIQSRQDCLFQNKCQMHYRNPVMVWSPKGPKIPTVKLQVTAACLDTERHPVIDMLKSVQHTESREGFIRSHYYHNRSKNKYPKRNGLYSSNNTLVLTPPSSRSNQTFLLLHFHLFDLAEDDSLQVLGSSLECRTDWSKGGTYAVSSGNIDKVSVFFSQGQSTESGDGFEICFQWFTTSNKSSALKEFELTLSKCRKYRKSFKANAELAVHDVIQTVYTEDTTGVVRSHPDFPWNYPRPRTAAACRTWHPDRAGSNPWQRGRASVRARLWDTATHVLTAPLGLSTVRLMAGRVGLARGDRLQVCGTNGSEFRIEAGKTYDIQSQTVTLNFRIQVSDLHTSQGFQLCYKWFSLDSVDPVEPDLCKSFSLKVRCPKRDGKSKKSKSKRRRVRRASVKPRLPRECKP